MQDVDEATFELFRAGDTNAVAVVFEVYHRRLIGFIRLFTRSQELAEEVAQEVFLTTYRHRERLRGPRQLRTWLFMLGRREAIREMNRRCHAMEFGVDFDSLAHLAQAEQASQPNGIRLVELGKYLQESLKALSERDRELIVLRYFQELQIKEIAEVMALPMGSVGVMIQRALEKLRAEFERHGWSFEEFIE